MSTLHKSEVKSAMSLCLTAFLSQRMGLTEDSSFREEKKLLLYYLIVQPIEEQVRLRILSPPWPNNHLLYKELLQPQTEDVRSGKIL